VRRELRDYCGQTATAELDLEFARAAAEGRPAEKDQPAVVAPEVPPLTAADGKILEALAARRPVAMPQAELEAHTGLSRGTIGPRLAFLREQGLVCRPDGKKTGNALTPLGVQVASAGR
jgi:hypothetical protein